MRRVPFSVILCVLLGGEEVFSQRLNRRKLARKIFDWLCCVLRCCHDNILLTSTAPCAGQNWSGAPTAPSTAMYPRQRHTHETFVNCMQQNGEPLPLFWNCVCKSYIFTCRLLLLCVLEICCISFFVKRWKSKKFSVCWKKCVTLKM